MVYRYNLNIILRGDIYVSQDMFWQETAKNTWRDRSRRLVSGVMWWPHNVYSDVTCHWDVLLKWLCRHRAV